MANPAVREECSNVGWVATVTELCEKPSLLSGNYEPPSSYCRNLLSHQRHDSCENIEVTAENVTRLLKHSSGGELERSSSGKQVCASLSQSDVCCGSNAAV